jgi:DNA-binding MarR family transcriptional regulator
VSERVSTSERFVSIVAVFRRTAQLMVADLVERLDEAGFPDLSPAFHPVFENIDRDGTRLTELAARAAITRQSMSELVVALERRGYVERRPDPSDGRARLIALTDKGRRLARAAIVALGDIEASWEERWQRAGHEGRLRPAVEAALAPSVLRH